MMMMKCYAAFGLFLSITVTIQSQLTVIWQGVPVTGPLLIYHSEIQQTVNNSSLTCRHPTGPVAWYLANGNILHNSGGTFNNKITNGGRQAQIMRGRDGGDERDLDGLWTCRLNHVAGARAFHVGIYDDNPPTGNGAITSDPTVRGQSFSYTSNPTSFQLVSESTGGPPTTNYWTRNGVDITNNYSFSISISFTGSHDDAGHRAANYQSTLTVTGRQPGVYQYHVSNRRTTGTRSSRNVTIDDLLAPTISSMSLLTSTSVNISWTQPVGGLMVDIYRVTLTGMCPGFISHTREGTTISTSIVIDGLKENSSYTVTISAVNNQSNAINITSGLTITTLEAAPSGPPVIVMPPTVSSSSITVNWNEIPCTQRNGRIIRYEVEFGPSGEGTISGRSFTTNGRTPFTNYTFRVRGVNSEGPGPYSDLIMITTSEAAPGPVLSLMGTPTLSTVILTWSPPQQRNGIIAHYTVTYRVNRHAPVTRDINNPDTTTFTISSLFPQTTISDISVRASTSAGGPGPERTLEDVVTLTRPPEVMGVDVEILTDTSVRVSWERVLNIPEITHYTVSYSRAGSRKRQAAGEESRNAPSSSSSVDIEGLSGGARSYLFVVVAVATVNNVEISGERPTIPFIFPSSSSDGDVCSGDVSNAIVLTFILTFLLTIILHTIVMLVVCYIIYRVCYTNKTKSTNKQTEKGNTGDTYEVITTKVDSHDFAMKECAAYGPVSSTQAQYEAMSSPQTEGTYESV